MNEKNFEYLKKLLENLGFGNKLNGVLQQAMERGFNTFTLGLNNSYLSEEAKILGTPHKDIVKYRLNFAKSKTSDSVFLNDYQAHLFKPLEITPRSHTFDLEHDHRITAIQAYRLLSGFSIEKKVFLPRREGAEPNESLPESKKVWLKINLEVIDAYEQHPLRKFYPEYGYDLAAAIDKYPFTNLSSGGIREIALQDLSNGKLFKTEMRLFDQVFPAYVAANPQSRSLEIYDKELKRISDRQIFPDKIEKLDHGAGLAEAATPSDLDRNRDHPWEQDADHDNLHKIGR